MKSEMKSRIRGIEKFLSDVRREFHRNPEPSFKEFETQKMIIEHLSALGIESKKCFGTGVIGIIKGKGEKTIALRAEMDALPITEEMTELNKDYISRNEGMMHACAHDAHMAMLIGTAKLFSELSRRLKGNVKLIFQPGEETVPGGAKGMLKSGVLRNPDVDAILGIHILGSIKAGEIGTRKGALMASSDIFNITIKGKGGHGAYPQECIDPIVITAKFILSAQTIVSRELNPLRAGVISFGKVESGRKENIIPESVYIEGTTRALDEESRLKMKQSLRRILEGVIKAHDSGQNKASFEFNYIDGYPVLINSQGFTEFVVSVLTKHFGERVRECEPLMVGEDFSYFLKRVQGTFMLLGTNNPARGIVHMNHSPRFDIDERVLPLGVEIFAGTILEYLK